MSTYVYLKCLDHDPPLLASAESGQHLYDLPQIRRDIENRDLLVTVHESSEGFLDRGSYFLNNTVHFFISHRKCRIGIEDEYGRDHPTTEPAPTEGA